MVSNLVSISFNSPFFQRRGSSPYWKTIRIDKQEKLAAIYQRMNSRERYDYLEQHYPILLQRVTLTYLAPYLGIARETLSRIRGRRV